jgi:hypothetical protein
VKFDTDIGRDEDNAISRWAFDEMITIDDNCDDWRNEAVVVEWTSGWGEIRHRAGCLC